MAELNRPELLSEIAAGLTSQIPALRAMATLVLSESKLPEAEAPLLNTLDSSDRHLVTQVMVLLASKYKQPEWSPTWDDDKKWDDMLQHWRRFREEAQAGAGR
jgi:hypothetical protein